MKFGNYIGIVIERRPDHDTPHPHQRHTHNHPEQPAIEWFLKLDYEHTFGPDYEGNDYK